MKKLTLLRTNQSKNETLGVLMVFDGPTMVFHCHTLELPWRNNERMISCVPPGTYKIVLEYSPKFDEYLWELKGVPGRSEAKIHTANYVHQLNGCIAPGKSYVDLNGDGLVDVTNSRKTLNQLHKVLSDISETTITINEQF